MTTKLTTSNLSAETLAAISGPRISNVKITDSSYNLIDDTAANISGGFIIINGQNFISNCQVLIDNTPATTVTFVSNSVIRAQVPASAEGTTKSIYVVNPDGSSAIIINGLTYSAFPAWSTGSTLTSFEALVPVSIQLSAPSATVYTLAAANTLPSSLSLYANGLIAGTVAANTTTNYNFTVNAKDAENQDTNRNFTLPITQNIEPAWVTAADLGSEFVDANYSNTLVATDLSNVTYSVAAGSSLPSSLTLAANGLLSGNVSAANTYSFGIVATDTANLSNTRTFTITISFSNDTYFKNTTLLLNGETTVTPFISDASTTNANLIINGDTKPVLFNPYTPGYYSNYFDGAGDCLPVPDNVALQFSTGDFTVELWWYPTSLATDQGFLGSSSTAGYDFCWRTSTGFNIGRINTAFDNSFAFTPTLGQWYHVAYSRSGTSLKVFVNGSQVGSTATNSISYVPGSGGAVIGGSTTGDRLLTGYISNLRLVKGTAVYTSNFTPNTTPLTAIANTSLLTCQSNRLIDNSTNNFTITKNGDTLVSPNIPFTPNSSYSTYGSTYFDVTGDYLTAPSNVALNLPGDFTIEFWVYPTASIVNKSIAGTTSSSMHFDSGGYFYLLNSTGQYLRATDASFLTLNTWTHVSISRSGSTLKFFRNGIDNGVAENVGSASTATFTFSGLNIGYSPHVNAISYLTGYISNFRIVKGTAVYTTAFTPPTAPLTAIANTSLLTLQYNGGANNQGIIDNSNFNNIITRNGNTSQGTFSPYSVTGWSNYFDGTGDDLTTTTNAVFTFGTGDFTIEMWVYVTANPGDYAYFYAQGPNTSASMGLYLSAGKINVWNGSNIIVGSTTYSLNRWYHVALSRTGTSLKLFLDGVQDGSATNSSNITTGSTYGSTVARWVEIGDSRYFAGYISNLRVVKGTAVYTANFTPSTTPLTAIANTSLLTCQSNRFIDNSPNSFTLTKAGDVSVQALDPFGSVPEAVPISYSNYFDGTGDYLYTSASSANAMETGDYTVEAWIYVTAAFGTTGSGRGAIISNRGQESATNAFMLQHYNGKIYFGTSNIDVIVGNTTLSTNTWYHVVVSRSSGTVRLFLNGVSDATAVTGNNTNHSATNAFYVGIDGAYGAYPFTGYISNARLVKGTAVYTSTFTPSTTPLTAIANTSLLTCQSTRMIDNSTNAFTITAVGNTVPRIFNPFGYTEQTYTSYTPSLHGGSAYFDGTTDYLTAASTSVFGYGTGDFTIEFWFNPNSTGLQSVFSHLTSVVSINPHIYIDTTIRYFTNDGVRITGSTLSIGQWHHIALCRASGSTRLFINGTQSGTTYSDSNNYGTTAPLGIGTYWSSGSPVTTNTVNGYLSDIRVTKGFAIYTSNFVPPAQALSNYSTTNPASLLLNFNNGGIIDQHGTNVLETVGNAQLSTAVKKYGSSSMRFDGTGDYLTIRNSQNFAFGSGNWTIELWIYLNSSARQGFVALGDGSGTNVPWEIGVNASGKFRLLTQTSGGQIIMDGTTTPTTGIWYHVAGVRNGGTATLYVNGVAEATSSSLSTNSLTTENNAIQVGKYSYGFELNGYIDDLRITKDVARYTTTFTPPTSAFIAK